MPRAPRLHRRRRPSAAAACAACAAGTPFAPACGRPCTGSGVGACSSDSPSPSWPCSPNPQLACAPAPHERQHARTGSGGEPVQPAVGREGHGVKVAAGHGHHTAPSRQRCGRLFVTRPPRGAGIAQRRESQRLCGGLLHGQRCVRASRNHVHLAGGATQAAGRGGRRRRQQRIGWRHGGGRRAGVGVGVSVGIGCAQTAAAPAARGRGGHAAAD